MEPECVKFHTKPGENIRLLQDNQVAERKLFFKADGAVVFTADPIPRGKVFKVYFMDKARVDGTPGIGVTTVDPSSSSAVIPQSLSYCMKKQFWVVRQMESYHGQEIKESRYFDKELKDMETMSVLVSEYGEMHLLVNDNDVGVIWRDLPIDKPLWGIVDVNGKLKKIRAEFVAPEIDLKEDEKLSTEDQLKDILYPTEKSQLAHSIKLTRSMNLTTNSTATSPDTDVTQSLFLPDLNGLTEGKRAQSAMDLATRKKKSKTLFGGKRKSRDQPLPLIQEEGGAERLAKLDYGGSRWELGDIESSSIGVQSLDTRRPRGASLLHEELQSQHQATFKGNVLKNAYSLQDIGPRRGRSKTLGGLFGRKTNKDDDKEKAGSSPKTTKSKKKQRSQDMSDMKEEGREEEERHPTEARDKFEQSIDIGSLAQSKIGLFGIRKASSTMDMSSRSRTKSFLDFFKPDKKQTKPSRVSVQSWKKDSVSGSTDEQPHSLDEEEANGVSSDKEEESRRAAVVRQLPVVTVGSYDENDGGEDEEFELRKAQSSFELGPRQQYPLLRSKLADKKEELGTTANKERMADEESLDQTDKTLNHEVEVDSTIRLEAVTQRGEGEESASGGADSGHTPELVKKKTKKHKKDKVKKKKKRKPQQDNDKKDEKKAEVSDSEQIVSKKEEAVEEKKIPAIESTSIEETNTPIAEETVTKEETPTAADLTATKELFKNTTVYDPTATQTEEQEEEPVETKEKPLTKEELFRSTLVYDPRGTAMKEENSDNGAADSTSKEQEEPVSKAKPMTKEDLFRNTPVYDPRATTIVKEEEKEPPLPETNSTPATPTKQKDLMVNKEEENEKKHQIFQYRPSPLRGRRQSTKNYTQSPPGTPTKATEQAQDEHTVTNQKDEEPPLSETPTKEKDTVTKEEDNGKKHPSFQYRPSPVRGRKQSRKDDTTPQSPPATPTKDEAQDTDNRKVSTPIDIPTRESRSKSFMSSLFQHKKSPKKSSQTEDKIDEKPSDAAAVSVRAEPRDDKMVDEIKELQRDNDRLREEAERLKESTIELRQRLNQVKQEKAEVEEKWLELQSRVTEEVADIRFWVAPCREVELTTQIIGSGACGMVHMGWFRGKKVAVKQIHPKKVAPLDPLLVQRELSLLSKIHHPNLVLLVAAVLDHPSGSPLLVTELMDMSLRTAYEQDKLTGSKAKLAVIRDIAAGLNYLHLQPDPVIHRDITSANVLLLALAEGRWIAKLSDFVSAKLVRLAGAIDPYTAPETVSSQPPSLSPKLDVFSFGVLLCELISQQYPDPKRLPAMLERVRESWPAMHDLVQCCTHTDPTNRISMSDVLTKLPLP